MLRWTYTRLSQVADEEQKKKVIGIYISNFETYTRYSRVADEKKVSGSDCHFKLSKEGVLKKSLGNHAVK